MLCDENNLTLAVFKSVFKAKRSSICGSNTLDDGCSISDDCDTVNCKMKFVDKPITIKLKVFVFIDFASFFISFVTYGKKKKDIACDLKDKN